MPVVQSFIVFLLIDHTPHSVRAKRILVQASRFLSLINACSLYALHLPQGIASANAQTVSLASSEVLVSGAVAGAISKLIVLPFDTVRKRLQVRFQQAMVARERVEIIFFVK